MNVVSPCRRIHCRKIPPCKFIQDQPESRLQSFVNRISDGMNQLVPEEAISNVGRPLRKENPAYGGCVMFERGDTKAGAVVGVKASH